MTGDEFTTAAAQLERALREASLVVERAEMQGGNVRWWLPVSAEEILGRWMQNNWRIRPATEPPPRNETPTRVLQLLPNQDDEDCA